MDIYIYSIPLYPIDISHKWYLYFILHFTAMISFPCRIRWLTKVRFPSGSIKFWEFTGDFPKDILVGGWATPLKNMKVNWDDYPIDDMENKKCSKPPTSIWTSLVFHWYFPGNCPTDSESSHPTEDLWKTTHGKSIEFWWFTEIYWFTYSRKTWVPFVSRPRT